MSRIEKMQRLCLQMHNLLTGYEQEANRLEETLASLRAEVESTPIELDLDSGEPITAEALSAIMTHRERHQDWFANNGRLTLTVKVTGDWDLSYASMYGGNVSSYRKLRNMAEVRALISLLGVKPYAEIAP